MNFFSNRIVNPAGKTASFDEWIQKVLKEAAQKNEQVATEQVVENKTASKPVEAKCGKEMGESSDAGKVTETHTEAGPGDDENPEPKILINNDPNYQKPKKGEESNKSAPKSEGKKEEKKDDKKEDKKANLVSKFQKVASMDRAAKLELFKLLSQNPNNPIQYVQAMTGLKFANMTPEEKKGFIDFWEVIFPADYVKEMIADR